MAIEVKIKGDSELVVKFDEWPGNMRQQLRQAIGQQTRNLQEMVEDQKLTGQVLKNRSGDLRRSIVGSVTETENSITGTVATNLEYAAIHEYGFKGPVNVREHVRTINQAFGKTLKAPVTFTVRSHVMNMNMPQRSYLRSSLADSIPSIRDALKEAVERSVAN